MAGLVGYASSDEDEEIEQVAQAEEPQPTEVKETAKDGSKDINIPNKTETSQDAIKSPSSKAEGNVVTSIQQSAVPLGPSLPSMDEPPVEDEGEPGQAPLSPYSANRALLRDLTLPSHPNMDIPPSPPGSPPPNANKKLEQFLELKKKGIHFNAKLEQSSGLKNPSLMDKLLNFAEIDESNQYTTTLPTDLWDPNGFPEWAFKDRLRKSQAKIAKEAEAERTSGARTAVDFVPSTTTVGGTTASTGGLSRGEKRKGGWK